MKLSNKRQQSAYLFALFCLTSLCLMAGGCAEETKPPEGTSYYTGPMDDKGKKTQGAQTDPGVTKGGAKAE